MPTSAPVQLAASFTRPARRGLLDFRFADYEIDIGRHELRRSGEIVPIEPQVFDLLVHLVRHRDRTVSKDELFATIWSGRIVSDAALSSRIKAARKAIGDNGDAQILIRTIQKRGFRFVGAVEDMAREPTAAAAARSAPAESTANVVDFMPSPALAPRAREIVAAPATAPSGGRASVAVLPFENLSGDAENEYFSYGMMEDLIRLLARNRWLTVISRHTTAAYTDADFNIREVGEALSARYLLVGSIRRNHDTVKISIELVRAADGTQLWADSYNVQLENIFDIQEEMARQISATIEPELGKIEQQLASRKPPSNLDAWECYQRASWHLCAFTPSGFDSAEQFLHRAIELDRSSRAMRRSAMSTSSGRCMRPAGTRARLEAGMKSARAAVALDDRDCMSHFVLGRALCLMRRNEEAPRRSISPWSSIRASPRPTSHKGSISSGPGARSRRSPCWIAPSC